MPNNIFPRIKGIVYIKNALIKKVSNISAGPNSIAKFLIVSDNF